MNGPQSGSRTQSPGIFSELSASAATTVKPALGAVKPEERGMAAPQPEHADAHKDVRKADSESSTPSATGDSGTPATALVRSASPSGSSVNAVVPAGPDPGATAAGAMQQLETPSSAAVDVQGIGKQNDLASATKAPDGRAAVSDTQALPAINSAKVIQSMQGSEMRVGMHSSDLGTISVNTSLNRESIAAQISFEHMDLGKALTAHLPAIEAKLSSDYGVHARVEVRDQSMGSAGENGRGDGRRGDGGSSSAAHTNGTLSAGSTYPGSSLATVETAGGHMLEGMRLDIQA